MILEKIRNSDQKKNRKEEKKINVWWKRKKLKMID